jgi:hypothetical protein
MVKKDMWKLVVMIQGVLDAAPIRPLRKDLEDANVSVCSMTD